MKINCKYKHAPSRFERWSCSNVLQAAQRNQTAHDVIVSFIFQLIDIYFTNSGYQAEKEI